ncbi:Phosphoserine phosphatase RsbU [Streptomyces sp. ADI96-02]|uniref:PP2C family protein-serine/threonine phosphatase n=1 Tax=Streptomyces sp. ADI96-02 TaxID=1522760 RepID=UPI000F554C1B|nr:GAF domain-containing SpoIIE family protein phosphatase [Streptomyces sp. ADI96-02]RPK56819.1 Phosphoserine phosphatase RsbU [Streptomyces sp. ADI96-02]
MTVAEGALHPGSAPPPADEERRLAAVRRYQILDTPCDGAFDKVASLAAQIFRTPFATVSIVDSDRVWFMATSGLSGTTEIARASGLCASAILDGAPYIVTDTLTDPRTAAGPLVHGGIGVRFYAAAPITTADGYHLGTVNVLDTEPRQVTEEQLAALQNLAALVMDQLELRLSAIRTVTAERQMRTAAEGLARTLQRTLLPPALPRVPGLGTAAAYHTASEYEVGGDFYDLFPLDDGRWAFFLGDVCGKGADAAALTSLTRYTLRAAAIYDPDPCAVLANLDTVLKGEYQGTNPRYCTAVFGVLQPEDDGSFALTLAGGGHPPALAVRADGTVEPVRTTGGQLIGLLPAPRFTQTATRLRPGDALLLYTDGLTEARTPGGSLLEEQGLAAHLAAGVWHDADGLLAGVHQLLTGLGAGVNDDTALLALSVPTRRTEPVQETR